MRMPDVSPCPFCVADGVILQNNLAYVRFDKTPVCQEHCLILPFRHVADYFDTSAEERTALLALADLKRVGR
jgi:diadenosine tetraphosphate (Ap4A) HIT family hydrolase